MIYLHPFQGALVFGVLSPGRRSRLPWAGLLTPPWGELLMPGELAITCTPFRVHIVFGVLSPGRRSRLPWAGLLTPLWGELLMPGELSVKAISSSPGLRPQCLPDSQDTSAVANRLPLDDVYSPFFTVAFSCACSPLADSLPGRFATWQVRCHLPTPPVQWSCC